MAAWPNESVGPQSPRVGRPHRDRSKNKAARKAARLNRR